MLITQKCLRSRILKNVVFIVLLLKTCLVFTQKKVIVIDPGHGGNDSGAIGVYNLKEKEIVFKIAKEIVALNTSLFGKRLDIYLTRYKDNLISLSDRTKLAKTLQADVFVSLHCNASPYFSKGIEVFVNSINDKNTKPSIDLGLCILKETTQKLRFKQRGVKFANFQVLRNAKYYPAVLVEMGFVTNIDEAGYFIKPQNIRAMALAILLGINNYLK